MVDLRHIGNVDEALAVDHRSGDRVVGATVSLPQLLCERPRIRVFATARKLATLIYRLLRWGQPYVDEGATAYEARYHQQRIGRLAATAKQLGYQLAPINA